MKRVGALVLPVSMMLLVGCSLSRLYQMQQRGKSYDYEQFNFNDLVKLYIQKDQSAPATIEGIYSVSILIVKKGKGLLSSTEKERTVQRKENYSKVAIIRDPGNANREFIEVSLDKDFQVSHSIVGEFNRASDGGLLVYKHFEPKGKSFSYNFTYDGSGDILEGVRVENSGSSTFTYKITYLRLLPKTATR